MTLAHQHFEGSGWSLTGSTGIMAAGLAQDSVVFAMGAIADPAVGVSQTLKRAPIEIEGIQLTFTAIAAFGTVLAGRSLKLYRADTNARTLPTGGANLTPRPKRTLDQTQDNGLQSGVARISTTTGLTTTGFTRDTVPLATYDLSGVFAAGARVPPLELFEKRNGSPIWLDPGEILVISNPVAFDATTPTWQLTVNIDYRSRDAL
ncbi:MAG TPA: hypothetical protein VFZ00_11335 [Solirubrobacter sp.]|nr:hypothetical protein [Solirubrobacter sp.]